MKKIYSYIVLLITLFLSCTTALTVNTFNVSGRVVFCDEGYEGATVTLISPRFGEVSVISGTNGEYVFEDIWDGDYTIVFSSDLVEFYPPQLEAKVSGVDKVCDDVIVVKSWEQIWGDSGDEKILSVIQTNDYGFIACGNKGINNLQAIVYKFDRNGILEWKNEYVIGVSCSFSDVREYNDGYLLCGTSRSDSIKTDGIILYLNSGGTEVGSYTGSNAYNDALNSIVVTGNAVFVIGNTEGSSGSATDFSILKFMGDLTNTPDSYRAASIIDGNHSFITGLSISSYLYFAGNAVDNNVSEQAVIYRMTSNLNDGSAITHAYFDNQLSSSKGIVANNGMIYAIFGIKDNMGGVSYGRLCMINPNTLTIIGNAIERDKKTVFNCIASLKNGDILIGGSVETEATGFSIPFIACYGASLQFKYIKYFDRGYTGFDAINSIKQTHDGGFILGGTVSGGETAGQQYLFLKLNRNGDIYSK